MILQYLSKVKLENKEQTIETIKDNVFNVAIFKDKIEVNFNEPDGKSTVAYLKKDSQIYSMYLLNDNFKTLKRLI